MNPVLKGSLLTLVFCVVSEFIYKIYRRRKYNVKTNQESESESRLSSTSLQVLFFPDKEVACREYFITGNGCLKSSCRFSHGKTSLSELYRHMISCQVTMDVCVFVMTCKDLADILLKLFKKGVKIRVITDNEQHSIDGSQIWPLRKAGIPVRMNHSTYLMHHKFAVIDNRVLINGSFNWTRQAITGNQENVIITDDAAVTSLFVAEFQQLWDEFEPNKMGLLGDTK